MTSNGKTDMTLHQWNFRKCKQRGFTLLEVIVALAITGFILGSLFTLVGQSKQLSWRAEESLIRATQIRTAANFALLEDEYNDVEPILVDEIYQVRSGEFLEDPERKTQAMNYALQEFELDDPERDVTISASRWVELELPR